MFGFRWLKALAIAGLFVWGLLATALLRPALDRVLGRRSQRVWDSIRRHWHRSVCRVLRVRISMTGDMDPQAGLIVANHISWLDIIVLGSGGFPDFIAKEEVAHWPVVGYLAKRAGTLFIRRGDVGQTQATAEQMAWRFRQGRQLVLFPEATTTSGDRVLRFQSKLFKPAHLAEVAVQAVAIRYVGEASEIAPFVGEDEFLIHLWRMMKLESIDVHLYANSIHPAGWEPGRIAALTRAQIIEALGDERGSLNHRQDEAQAEPA